ncbi:hypothetical protein E2562_027763 [Oryza meyeriana var. granulata]|uniref:Uncharacterized protein n=1 Tax=Oryza meyeriana var. granulata TaxID=110450 RepID=A0A6G1ECF7_9ORYZ|nr:hypothetical protein E2562_027763 [Oryza meyeriana var. granulata]
MDTLFRLVSLHHHHHHGHHHHQQQQAASSLPDQPHKSPYHQSYPSSRGSTSSPSSHHTHSHNHSYYHHHSHFHSHSHYNNNNSSNSNSNGNGNGNVGGGYYYHGSGGGGGGGGGYYCAEEQPAYLEECGNDHRFYMDEDFSSSSSSRQFHSGTGAPQQQQPSAAAPTPPPPPSSVGRHGLFEAADFSFPQVDISLDFGSPVSSSSGAGGAGTASSSTSSGRWAAQLLMECARAVAVRDSQRVQQLMWMLNELASPYGDVDQKLASYFLQGLFARLTNSGPRTLRTLAAASDQNASFDSTRRTALKFQELSPWTPFGHVAANGAILESFLEAAAAGASSSSSSSSAQPPRLHILDLSNTFCTQWPTLLEALATRSSDDTPHLSITTVVPTVAPSAAAQSVMREIGQRLEKFARLMGVPFRFRAVHHAGDLADLDLAALDLREGGATTALAVNCVNALRGVAPGGARRRDAFVASLRRLEPRVVTVVEEEADLAASEADAPSEGDTEATFMKVFGEGLRFFSAYMDSLEESFPKTSNERLALERAVGRAIVDLVSCPASESAERRETGASWVRRMRSAGFSPAAFSEDVADDVRSLLRRYREGWSMRDAGGTDDAAADGAFLAWKEQPVVWASAWKP